jgi:Na+-transporting NADH:ubiquinone oxidoreductase subunit NqrC
MVNEKKVRAHILLDKNSMTIQGIYFPTGSEVNKLGSNVDKFSQQLTGSAINFSADNFELKPWDDQIPAKGDVIIDGISGATKICQASVDMLNNQLPFYHAYFEAN